MFFNKICVMHMILNKLKICLFWKMTKKLSKMYQIVLNMYMCNMVNKYAITEEVTFFNFRVKFDLV